MTRKSLTYSMALLFAVSTWSLLAVAQVPGTMPPVRSGQGQGHHARPCWQVAGVSQAAVRQHRALEESAHSKIESVCANSSLTPQQKRERIHEIREQTRMKAEALIPPQKEQALKACREERGEVHHAGGRGMEREGPCGDMPMGPGAKIPPASIPKP